MASDPDVLRELSKLNDEENKEIEQVNKRIKDKQNQIDAMKQEMIVMKQEIPEIRAKYAGRKRDCRKRCATEFLDIAQQWTVKLQEAQKTVEEAQKTAEEAQKTAEEAQKTVEEAQKTAEVAQQNVDEARKKALELMDDQPKVSELGVERGSTHVPASSTSD